MFSVPSCPSVGSCPAPEYRATVVAGERVGVMDVTPDRIHASDQVSCSQDYVLD